MPYQVLGDRSGAAAVTVTWTRSARARSSGVILAMASRSACSPSAFFTPLFPSARSSAARCFIAARSSALNPSDSVCTVSVDILETPLVVSGLTLARAGERGQGHHDDPAAGRCVTGRRADRGTASLSAAWAMPLRCSLQRSRQDVGRLRVPLTDLTGTYSRAAHQVLREAGVAVRGSPSHDVVAPLVIGADRRHDVVAFVVVESVAVGEKPEAGKCPASPGVPDQLVRTDGGPQPCRAGDVPDAAAGAGQVEVDERHRSPLPEDDVVQVHVVGADQSAGEGRRR